MTSCKYLTSTFDLHAKCKTMSSGQDWRGYLPKFLQERGSEFSDMSDRNDDNDSDNSGDGQGLFSGPISSKSRPTKPIRPKRQQQRERERYRSRSPARSRSRSVRSFDSYNRSLSRSPVRRQSRSRSRSPLSQKYHSGRPTFSPRTPPTSNYRSRSMSQSRSPTPRNQNSPSQSYSSRSPSYRSQSRSPGPNPRRRHRSYRSGSESSQRSGYDVDDKWSSLQKSDDEHRGRGADGQKYKKKRKSHQRSRSHSPQGSNFSDARSDFSSDYDANNYQSESWPWATTNDNDEEEQDDGEIEMPVMGRLFVGNLDPKACKMDMEEIFEPFGNCEIYIGRNPGGYAFIQYDNDEDAIKCIRALDKTSILGSTTQIRVKPCLPRIGGKVPYGKPGYVRGRSHNWIGLDGTKKSRADKLSKGVWPFTHRPEPRGGFRPRGSRVRGRGRGRGRGVRGRGRGASRSRGRGRGGRRSFIGRGRGANVYNETDTGYGDDEESDFKPPKPYREKSFQGGLRQKCGRGFKSRGQRFGSQSPLKNRPVLLDTPTFKQPLLDSSRPVLLPTPSEPPLQDTPTTPPAPKSYKKGRPSSRRHRDTTPDDSSYRYQDEHDEDYRKTRKGKSSIYKKYKQGTRYSDFRYDKEHHDDDYQSSAGGSALWGPSSSGERSSRSAASHAHYSNYEWPSSSQHQGYEQQQQQHHEYDYSAWSHHHQQQAAPPPAPAAPAQATSYAGYDQSGYSNPAPTSHWPPPAPASGTGSEYHQQSAYHHQPSVPYTDPATGYQWPTAAQTAHHGYAAPSQSSALPAPPYSTEQLTHLAKQYPELASSNILAQVTKEQSRKSRKDSSSRKSKGKNDGYERLAVAYERLASVLEKAFQEDAPRPPLPPRAATPGHRSPERRSRSSRGTRGYSDSPGRPSTPTQDEMDTSRRTVVYPTKEYKLF